ncbi:FAD-dependent catabolic D-arginine dehydrogenase DauA [Sphingosinicella ginsenosidimutans]|uniref:FAD-binding oxidoreductase n=1 Tax=Allosphingosinicella ginsenosidimutans TaxID=1176539 RepID=A0A5C6TVL8_9SPHN|nr:FAD-dependent oxidoreductase [Sphingosinicella ginsenosidimutans]TXC63905.1 FAD-binding oxidoreductase [Sphingosinicella ginsenosidimutans]
MSDADFLIIGGGIAGLSAAARLAAHGRVLVLEAEDATGYHSSGRSVAFSHYGIGGEAVRAMTAWSRAFFQDDPALARTASSLYFADEESRPRLDALGAAMSEFSDSIEPVDAAAIARLCPALRTGAGGAIAGLHDPTGLKLDADALLQRVARDMRAKGGSVLPGRRVASIEATGGGWRVRDETGETHEAPVLVNAAGAWADRIAAMAGVDPIGLAPRRRTIIVVDPPAGAEIAGWPFVHSVAGDFYMLPEAGRLLVSPVDEVEDDPCDAAPEDYDIALAADRLEHYTTVAVTRIAHRWAGLRTFTGDRVPTAGFAADAPGFFWLAGQGGYGLQTAPAMAAAVESLIAGTPWPDGLAQLGVTAATIGPERLRAPACC